MFSQLTVYRPKAPLRHLAPKDISSLTYLSRYLDQLNLPTNRINQPTPTLYYFSVPNEINKSKKLGNATTEISENKEPENTPTKTNNTHNTLQSHSTASTFQNTIQLSCQSTPISVVDKSFVNNTVTNKTFLLLLPKISSKEYAGKYLCTVCLKEVKKN